MTTSTPFEPVISIGIVAVPERRDMAKDFISRLDDPSCASIFIDVMRQGSWYNTRRAWLGAFPGATHQIAVEEDVIPCRNFVRTSAEIARLLPDEVVSFYSSKGDTARVMKAKKQGIHWYKKDSVPSGQCVMMPVKRAVEFVNWCDKYVDPRIAIHEDENLWGWLQATNPISYYTVPNIVQHVGQMRSALGWNNAGKESPDFIGEDVNGLSIDWRVGLDCPVSHEAYVNKNFIKAFSGKIE